jgi:hypothetical protein
VHCHIGPAFKNGVLNFGCEYALSGDCGERNVILAVTSGDHLNDFAIHTTELQAARDLMSLGER